jgi:hypothetical protein
MTAGLDVVAGGSPSLGSIATKGPVQDADPALKSFLLLEYLHYPEYAMVDALSSLCWKVAQIPKPEEFSLVVYTNQPRQKKNKKEHDDDVGGEDGDGDGSSEFVIEGSGEELKVLLMTLASLESGEMFGTDIGQNKKKNALTPWIPNNQRIQVRRRRRLNNGASYEMRAVVEDREESVVLSSRQIRAVIDCLDAFSELHPSFGLNEPRVEWPKTPLGRRLAATLNF